MRSSTLFLNIFIIVALLGMISGCAGMSENQTIISGEVTEASSGDVIEGALVEITSPEELSDNYTQTNEQGIFSFSVEVDEPTDIGIEVSYTGYSNVNTNLRIAPGSDVTDLIVELGDPGNNNNDGGNDSGGDEDQEEVGGEAGGPASITLNSIGSETINVAETGGTVNTAFTFAVEDSAGRAVGQGHEIIFEIIRGPEGGESITPSTGYTNPKGTVTSNLFSGDSSGTVRVEARIERPDVGLTIRSTPVLISISSGFPHPDNFNAAPRVYNFDAYGLIDESHTNNITASLGDKQGNPVKEGTAVYFSASNGGLVNGSASTNENGYASVNLSANGSMPSGHPMGPGFIDVVAQTVDKDNNYIEETTTLLLTSPRAMITVSPTTFSIANGGSQSFDITITDINGYPMAADTKFTVTTTPGLEASGDLVGLEQGDYFQPGIGITDFTVTISDSDPDRDDQNTDGSFTIQVATPSGEVSTRTIKGSRSKIR